MFHVMLSFSNSSFIEGDIMKVKEKRIDEIITKDKYKAHLVESVIRQMIDENKTVHVVVEEMVKPVKQAQSLRREDHQRRM